MSKEIEELQQKFRLLNKWKITIKKEPEHFGSATILPSKRKAVIYRAEKSTEPPDYILHELLHCTIRELLTRMNNKKIAGPIREAEETLVSDICSLINKSEKRFDLFDWMKQWLIAYDKGNGTELADKISEWVNHQPMCAG